MSSQFERSPEDLAAMQRTREKADQLKRDARAIMYWLDAKFPDLLVSLEVQRHFSCRDEEIAHVEPRVTDRPRRHEVRELAEKAFAALGWSLRPEGRDIYSDFYRPLRSQSAHARLAEIARVRKALDSVGGNDASQNATPPPEN